ncbi:hypothetical protein [Streptomyces iakyrus]|uniref:Uncharacterized protein n=1 Tax=Streptomyces iakyrus TaxID=68219 RepID=A0ABW8FJ70_9ACTN
MRSTTATVDEEEQRAAEHQSQAAGQRERGQPIALTTTATVG